MGSRLTDIVVIGGGAAGMMAAITAAQTGCRVIILEHKEMPGKKILATGNGRCNFTNTVQGLECYRGDTPAFVLPCLKQFSAERTIDFFRELGVWTKCRDGYCYPRTMQASSIRNALINELKRLGIHIYNGIGIRAVKKEKDYFIIESKTGDYRANKCILATGGSAFPKSGSDGSGYLYAKQLGHSCIKPLPALVSLHADADWLKEVKGVRTEASVTLYADGIATARDQGELQLTDYGISGIPTFQVSRFAAKALLDGKKVLAEVDFLPETDEDTLFRWIVSEVSAKKTILSMDELLSGLVNYKIAQVIAKKCKAFEKKLAGFSPKKIECIIFQTVINLKHTTLQITGTGNFQQAQVTAGGISTREVNEQTMESLLVNGLFFAGEILDVDGICGGYNLQWAWSSGYCAGKNAAEAIKKQW